MQPDPNKRFESDVRLHEPQDSARAIRQRAAAAAVPPEPKGSILVEELARLGRMIEKPSQFGREQNQMLQKQFLVVMQALVDERKDDLDFKQKVGDRLKTMVERQRAQQNGPQVQ